jgi:hypothetical protein
MYLSLLPIMAQLTHEGVEKLKPEQVAVLHEQLRGLQLALRPRARLLIDKMCFCERIYGHGVYEPLPEGHEFRARHDNEPGEQVQIYVELRNFCTECCPEGYRTCLSSQVEILDSQDKQVYYFDFQDSKRPLIRKTAWQDCFGNYRFFVPPLAPGVYKLVIQVKDITCKPQVRVARQALEFRVGS